MTLIKFFKYPSDCIINIHWAKEGKQSLYILGSFFYQKHFSLSVKWSMTVMIVCLNIYSLLSLSTRK
jgi:hypothetical protein